MDWLAFDFGPNYGDNFRGFLFLKALKRKFPDVRLTCWITPELYRRLEELRPRFDFIDRFLIWDRTPEETYGINFRILKRMIQEGKDFILENFPGGFGPNGQRYEKIIPNSEPWMTAKLLTHESLQAPDPVNQGDFLRRILNLSSEDLQSALPLFGQREGDVNSICVGLCRPEIHDRKQPSRAKINQIWQRILKWEGWILALDYQNWYPLPQFSKIGDWRMKSWAEKIPVLNKACLFIGIDGGLNHFAAACGCPTFSFYGDQNGEDFGQKVGPYPRRTPFGEHIAFGNFNQFLEGINQILSHLSGKNEMNSFVAGDAEATKGKMNLGPLDARPLDSLNLGPSTP
jgi:hypothetical protein